MHAVHEADLIEAEAHGEGDKFHQSAFAQYACSIIVALATLIGCDQMLIVFSLMAREATHRRPQSLRESEC
jgi:hypothetical protein